MNVSELKKLETNEYNSKLDEIAKNDTEVFLKVKLSGRRTFGEYEFEPKNGFAVHFGKHMDVLDLDKCDVYQLDQPQLNENQQIVLEWLKGIAVKNDNAPIVTFSAFGYQHFGAELPTDVEKAYQSMNGKQDLGVMSAYVNWAQEQEEE